MLHYEAIEPKTLDLLKALAALPGFEEFAFVGGTGLALQLGHRLSIDLDFFTQDEFQVETVVEELESNFDLNLTGKDRYSLNCRINDIKVDIIRHPYALVNKLVVEDGLSIWSIEDIAAAKISAITSRGAKKDFFDITEILKHIPLEEALNLFEKKYPSAERFMAMKSLSWFEDAERDPDPIVLNDLTWRKVKETIQEALRKIAFN